MTDLGQFFLYLAKLYAAEGHENGDSAAQRLKDHAPNAPASTGCPAQPCAEILNHRPMVDPLPEFAPFMPLLGRLDWHYSGLADGRIRPEMAEHMLTAELLGPDGMVKTDGLRVGLFFQSAGIDYVTREHKAEETFIMLAGQGDWSRDDQPARACVPGDVIHHQSMMRHKSITTKHPLLAAWRWNGNIGFEAYTLVG